MTITTRPYSRLVFVQAIITFLFVWAIIGSGFLIPYFITNNPVFMIAVIGVTLITFLIAAKQIGNNLHTRYEITEDTIHFTRDFLGVITVDIPTSQITNISYRRGLIFDRLFNTGALSVFTSGGDTADIVFSGILDVEETYRRADELLGLSGEVKNAKGNENQRKTKDSGAQHLYTLKPDARLATIFSVLQMFPVLFFIFLFSPGLLVSFFSEAGGLIVLLVLVILIFVFIGSMVLTYATQKRIYYAFYTNKLEYFDGFLVLKKATIPLERITDINEHRGLMERVAGISRIGIQTAGSQGSELQIRYIRNADEVVAYLKEVLKQYGRN